MSSATSPADFEELEHNPFAENGANSTYSGDTKDPLTSSTNNIASMDDETHSTTTTMATKSTNLDVAVSNMSIGDKVRTSSVMLSRVPVEVDTPSADNEDLKITVHDPQTVGEGLKAYTTYSVTTKTTSSLFKAQQMSVQRRFREFLWLYQQLSEHNPGVIVPPVPEKHAIGRFEEDFVENRKIQLDRMMYKIAKHPILSKDPHLVMFLEVDNLQTDSSADKKNKAGSSTSNFLSIFSDINQPKMQESDEDLEQKRQYIDTFETQLKGVAKVVDSMIKQRDSLCVAVGEFGDAAMNLSQAEINKSSEKNLVSFAQVQSQLKSLYAKQGDYDLFYLANTIDEYLRLIVSVKNAFSARVKAYQTWQNSEQALIKSRINLEKARLNSKSKPEKLTQIESEILECESKVVSSKKEFEDVSKLLKSEMEGFEVDKINDLQDCVKGYLKAVVVVQKQIVKVWEEYLRDLEPVTVAH